MQRCAKEEILQIITEPVVNPSTEKNSPMKTLTSNTPVQVFQNFTLAQLNIDKLYN